MSWPEAGWVDTAMLGVVALSALIGAVRGLTLELLSLAGWFVAYFAAQWLAPWLAPHLPVGTPGSALNQGLAFASAFVVALVAWSLLARFVAMLIGATPLRPLDRLLGAFFGVARGVLVLLVVATVMLYTTAGQSAGWRASTGAIWLNRVLAVVLPSLPVGSHESPAAQAV